MIRPKFCVVAEGMSLDAETNAISLFGLIEGITAPAFPLFVQRMICLALWEREEGDRENIDGRFQARLGNDQVLVQMRVDASFAGHPRCRTFIRLNGLLIPQPGILHFEFLLDDGIRAEFSISTAIAPVAVQEQQPARPAIQRRGRQDAREEV